MSDQPNTISSRAGAGALSILAILAGFALFAVIANVFYLRDRPEPVPHGTRTPEERRAFLSEYRAEQSEAAGTYGWIDRQEGRVRLPIDRAMELTVQDLNVRTTTNQR
jgi:hypothetical protein